MNISTFSLPEGCDLKLQTYWTDAVIHVTYKGDNILHLATVILGSPISIRRSVTGTKLIFDTEHPVYHVNQTKNIKVLIKEYDERAEAQRLLNENFKHFEGMKMDPGTMDMIRSTAQTSFLQTQGRIMRRAAEEAVQAEQRWAGQVFGGPIDAEVPRPTLATQVFHQELMLNGVRHVHTGNGLYRTDTGQQVRVESNGGFVTIHGLA